MTHDSDYSNGLHLRCLSAVLTCGLIVFFPAGCSRDDAAVSTGATSASPQTTTKRQAKAPSQYSYSLAHVINETDQEYGLNPAFKNYLETLAKKDPQLVWQKIESTFPSGAPTGLRSNLIPSFTGLLRLQDEWVPNERMAAMQDALDSILLHDDYRQHISQRLKDTPEDLWLQLESALTPHRVRALLDNKELLRNVLKRKQSAWLIEIKLPIRLKLKPQPWQDRLVGLHSYQAESKASVNRERVAELLFEDIQLRTRLSLNRELLYWSKQMQPFLANEHLKHLLAGMSGEGHPNIASSKLLSQALAQTESSLESKRTLDNAMQSYASENAALLSKQVAQSIAKNAIASDFESTATASVTGINVRLKTNRQELAKWLARRDRELLTQLLGPIAATEEVLLGESTRFVTNNAVGNLHSEFTGSLDRWYRNPEFVARGIAQEIGSPALVRISAYRLSRLAQSFYCKKLAAVLPFIESPFTLEIIDRNTQKNMEARWDYFGSDVYQNWYDSAASRLTNIIAKEPKAKAIAAMKTELPRQLAHALEGVTRDDTRRYSVYESLPLPDLIGQFTDEKQRMILVDKARVDMLALRYLADADADAAVACLTFAKNHNNRASVKEFQDSLTGMLDSLVLLWKTKATFRLTEEIEKRFSKYLRPQKELKTLDKKIFGYYKVAGQRIFVDAFNISQASPSMYPKAAAIRRALAKTSDPSGKNLFDSDGMIRATAFIELAGTVDLAVALGVAGYAAYGYGMYLFGASAATEVPAPGNPVGIVGMIVGGVIIAAEATITGLRVEPRDIERTRIQHGLHKHLGNSLLGQIYTHPKTRVGGSQLESSVADSKEQVKTAVPTTIKYREQIIKSLSEMKKAIFGTVKD